MDVAIIGGGICGLSLALNLKERGIACRVYERAPEIKELGVGITLLPHAMREFSALGLGDELLTAGIENRESRFYNRFGQLIYKESRGKLAGYQYPEVCIHRGRLHMILYKAARDRLGADAIRTDHECTGVEQDERGATVHFKAARKHACRRRGRLRGHQFGDPQAVLSRRQSGLRRHQYLARDHASQADPRWPHLYARGLHPHRQDRDLSDHR